VPPWPKQRGIRGRAAKTIDGAVAKAAAKPAAPPKEPGPTAGRQAGTGAQPKGGGDLPHDPEAARLLDQARLYLKTGKKTEAKKILHEIVEKYREPGKRAMHKSGWTSLAREWPVPTTAAHGARAGRASVRCRSHVSQPGALAVRIQTLRSAVQQGLHVAAGRGVHVPRDLRRQAGGERKRVARLGVAPQADKVDAHGRAACLSFTTALWSAVNICAYVAASGLMRKMCRARRPSGPASCRARPAPRSRLQPRIGHVAAFAGQRFGVVTALQREALVQRHVLRCMADPALIAHARSRSYTVEACGSWQVPRRSSHVRRWRAAHSPVRPC